MKNVNVKPLVALLIVISAAAWFVRARVGGASLDDLWTLFRLAPDVLTVDVIVLGWFTKWGWRWRWLQGWLVPFPDLNGTWEGEIQTSWKDEHGEVPGPIPAMLTIKQSFFRISCVVRTAESESRSFSEGFCLDSDDQRRQLCYSYTSRPKLAARPRSNPHDGTVMLQAIGDPANKLSGEYWTDRRTTGAMSLTLRTRKLLDELPKTFAAHPMTTRTSGP